MRHNDWPRIAGLASFSLLAVGCAAFLMASGELQQSVAGAGLMLLAAGQIITLGAAALSQRRSDERQAAQGRALRDTAETLRAAVARLDAIEGKVATPAPARPDTTIAEMQALRQQLQDLVDDIQHPAAHATAPPAASAPPPEPAPEASREHLDLLLEPVIELLTGETTHYRARLHMVDETESEVAHDELMRQAEHNNVRARLDIHLLRQVLPVFRRLRAKHPTMRLLVPVGGATLNHRDDLDRIIGILETAPDIVPGIVIELSHQGLAALDQVGTEGLARLGRLGSNMCLSAISLAGLDLPALRQLGVRFLDFDARSFEQGYGVAPAWADFVQYARSMQFQIVAGHVETAAQSLAAGRLARFGYGPYFAPPRRVRAEAGQVDAQAQFRAA